MKKRRASRANVGATATKELIKVKVAGAAKSYKKVSCHTTKAAAKTAAAKLRKAGYTSRVLFGAKGTKCVYKGPRRASGA